MRILANLFLIFFLLDGAVSLADQLLGLFAGIRPAVASIAALLAVFLYIALGIDRRLPKKIFIPLTLYSFWGALGFWPLSAIAGRASWLLLASACQVLLGISAMLWVRKRNGQSLLFTAGMLSSPIFRLRSTLLFLGGNILVLPLAVVFFGLASAHLFLDRHTAGFVRLSPAGIYMAERVYHLDDQVIRLVGMIHIGQEDYYRDIAGSLGANRMIILAEGVTDEDNLMQHRLDYGKVGSALGLVTQEKLEFAGTVISPEELERPYWGEGQDPPHILRADIDINQFDPFTIEFLNILGQTVFSGSSTTEGLRAYKAWIDEHVTPEAGQIIWEDILYRRNEVVIRYMNMALEKYDTIVIPWGAMHMPEIEKAVVERGFSRAETHERLSLDFRKIPYGKLLGLLRGRS
jgi:hypothetical protein